MAGGVSSERFHGKGVAGVVGFGQIEDKHRKFGPGGEIFGAELMADELDLYEAVEVHPGKPATVRARKGA